MEGESVSRKNLVYANVDGLAVFEGDIILGTVAELQDQTSDSGELLRSIGITGQQYRWPNKLIPYDIDPNLPNQQRVTDAIAHWQQKTCLRFILRTPANAAQYPNFVHFQPGDGCSSYVGMRGNSQAITLAAGCGLGNAIHEIGHTIGLWHEQSREDRGNFVQINWANIQAGVEHNFFQHITDGDDLGAYDYGSIMHYPGNAFSSNGQPTIVPLQPLPAGVTMGQRNGLSAGDIAGVSAMYGCVTKQPVTDTIKEVRKDPITDTIKEVRKDPITDTIKEVRKDPIRDTIKEVSKDPIQDPVKQPGLDLNSTRVENVSQPGLINPGIIKPRYAGGVSPFVLDTPSQFGGNCDQATDNAQMQIAEIEQALLELKRQEAELMLAYQAALEALGS